MSTTKASELKPALALTALVFAVRLFAFFFTQNWYGDAFSRIELAERWAVDPHWISAFGDGAWQYGPLHLYVLGVASKLWSAREHVGRVVSLLAGTATALPLFFLCKRLFGLHSAQNSVLVFAFWGLHVQFSTTAASEALSLLLFTACLAWFAADRWLPAALALTLACAVRYDVWMLIPVLAAVLALRRRFVPAVAFSAVALVFPVVWMIGNSRFHGDAQYPAHFINAFHRTWFVENEAVWGFWRHRALNLFFWPLVALFTLTPLIAVAGVVGARRHPQGWLLAVMLVPGVVFTTRSTIVGDFEPLARFAAGSMLVLIVFAGPVIDLRAVRVIAIFSFALAAFTWHREGKWPDAFRPLSPVTTQPAAVMEAAEQARRCQGTALIETEPRYYDLAAAFYAGVPVKLARNGEISGDCVIHF